MNTVETTFVSPHSSNALLGEGGYDMKNVTKLAVRFLNEYWNEIDLKKCEIEDTKVKFINKVRRSKSLAGWIVMEVMSWGCTNDYLKPYIVESEGHLVIKIGKSYYLYTGEDFYFKEVKPKYRKVVYFE